MFYMYFWKKNWGQGPGLIYLEFIEPNSLSIPGSAYWLLNYLLWNKCSVNSKSCVRLMIFKCFLFFKILALLNNQNYGLNYVPLIFMYWSLRVFEGRSFKEVCVLVTQSCLTLCDPMNCCPLDSSVRGILQARILEWVAHSLLQVIFPTQGSNPGLLHCRPTLYHLSHQGRPALIFKEVIKVK